MLSRSRTRSLFSKAETQPSPWYRVSAPASQCAAAPALATTSPEPSVFAAEDATVEGELERAHLLYVERRLRALRGERQSVVASTSSIDFGGFGGLVPTTLGFSLTRTALLVLGYVVLSTVLLRPLEGWDAADCAYFAIVTLTTVGYGDLSPSTSGGKLLAMVLSISGLVVVTASLTELIEAVVRHRRAHELAASLQRIDETTTLVRAWQQHEEEGESPNERHEQMASSKPVQQLQEEHGSHGARDWLHDLLRVDTARLHEVVAASCGDAAARRLGEWVRGAFWCLETALPLLLAILCGACLGYFVEGWRALDSAYFALISILTVGYGDFSPTTRLGRTLCTVLLPLACAASLRSVSRLGAALDYSGKQRQLSDAAASEADDDVRFERMHRLLATAASNRKDGIVTEADYVCST
jgi:voltage-gated potassium channel